MPLRGNTKTSAPKTSQLLGLALDGLRSRLPPGWKIDFGLDRPLGGGLRADGLLRVQSPDGTTALLALEVKTGTASLRSGLQSQAKAMVRGTNAVPVVVAPFVPPDIRRELAAQQIGYIDATGNVDVRAARPGLFITSRGAERNPWPTDRPARSLRAPKAARVVRVLMDCAEPLGVRQVAQLASVDPGYASRVMRLLREEVLVTAAPRGAVTKVNRRALVRRWSTDYDLTMSNRVLRAYEPRDLSALVLRIRDRAREQRFKYAFTASWAASRFAAIAPTRLLACFVESPESVVESLNLRIGEEVSNVWLIEPYDSVAFERGGKEQGVNLAAPAQVLVDLLTSPGRAPSEADAYEAWLSANDELWRG